MMTATLNWSWAFIDKLARLNVIQRQVPRPLGRVQKMYSLQKVSDHRSSYKWLYFLRAIHFLRLLSKGSGDRLSKQIERWWHCLSLSSWMSDLCGLFSWLPNVEECSKNIMVLNRSQVIISNGALFYFLRVWLIQVQTVGLIWQKSSLSSRDQFQR